VFQRNSQQLRLAPHKTFAVKGGGGRKPLQCRLGHLPLGVDDDVNRQMISPKQVRIFRVLVVLAAQSGDGAAHVEDRSCNLTGDHIHLIRIGGGNDHVRVARAGTGQNVGV